MLHFVVRQMLNSILLPFQSMVFVPFRRCFIEFERKKEVVTIIKELCDTSVGFLDKPLKLGFGVRYVDPNAVRSYAWTVNPP